MAEIAELSALDFFQDIDEEVITYLARGSEVRHAEQGEVLLHQHDRAIALFFLLTGKVQFLIHVAGLDDLLVGTDNEIGALIGWSVFRAPYRHTVTVRCEQDCRFLRMPRTLFTVLFEQSPRVAHTLLRRVAEVLAHRLVNNRDRLLTTSGAEGRALVETTSAKIASSSAMHFDRETLGSDQESTFAERQGRLKAEAVSPR
ncbi:MAG: cyclic nucleotide-binding domain-containing protein [Candidatus Thiodiazotropha sp.]|nr:cyclic nucleotide-binding domain-containing protein [Candidatus Thiodiazotropha sp.]MCM8885363.1 cyclic nucleotide-binding domain-containing protein [Candidatus Thiodiazotropha sp.]